MKIARVSCTVLRVPFRFPLLAKDSVATVNFVEIEADDGTIGYASSGTSMGTVIRDFINHDVAGVIVGMDPRDTDAVRHRMHWQLAPKYFTGAYAGMASLIDIALWDIKGKAAGMPIWRLLGGAQQTVPVYITFGLPQYNTEQLLEVARMHVANGNTGLKMIVGAPLDRGERLEGEASDALVDQDAARVFALREALGPDIDLMMDANFNYTYPQALRLAKQVETCNVTWFEDPVHMGDPLLMARMREQTSVPLAGGSQVSNLRYLRDYLLHEAVDYLQPNVRDIGGFTEGLKGAALAQAFNIPIQMGGNWPYENMHLHAAVANGGRVEFHWQGWQVTRALYDGLPEPENGTLTVPDAPGLGFTPKDGVIREYATDSR